MAIEHCNVHNQSAAHASLASYYIETEQFEKSVDEFLKAIEYGATAQLYMDVVNSYSKIGKMDEAQAYYDKALATNPDLAEPYYNMSLKKMTEMKDPATYAQIMSYLDKCLSLNPSFFMAHINKAALFREKVKRLKLLKN